VVITADRAVEILTEAIELANGGSPADFKYWHNKAKTALRLALGIDHPTLADFDRIHYSPLSWAYGGGPAEQRRQELRFAERQREGVREAVTILRCAIEEVRLVRREQSTEPATNGLHPIVLEAATQLVKDGHHRQAVESAARAVEQQLRTKLKASGSTGSKLVDAFSAQEPKAMKARLRFTAFEAGSDSWKNAQEGALHFGKGCFMRLRNLYSHHIDPSEAEAAEALAAFSLLARWVDEAEPVFASQDESVTSAPSEAKRST